MDFRVNEKRMQDICIEQRRRYKKFLGNEINQLDEKIFKISHYFLIYIIIYFLNVNTNNYSMDTNAKSTPVDKPLPYKIFFCKYAQIGMELPNSSWYVNLSANK